MATIKIYQQEYTLPVLANDRFQRLQQAIRERQHVIKESKRAVVREYWEEQPETSAPPEPLNWLRKWLPKPKSDPPPKRVPRTVTTYQPLTIEGHFQETRQLVQDYSAMLGMLTTHKAAYDRLLGQIANDIRQLAADRSQTIRQAEARRADLEAKAAQARDDSTLMWVQTQREQLLRSIRLLGQAAILIIKKLELFQEGLQRFADDQTVQKEVLSKVMGRVQLRYEAYQLQKDINQIEQDAAEMARVAVTFEELMRDCFGPFQEVIEEVVTIDGTFAHALEEIKGLTDIIQQEQSGTVTLPGEQDELLEFLIQSNLKRDRLTDVLENMHHSGQDVEFEVEFTVQDDAAVSVEQALENIHTLLDVRLPRVSETGSRIEIGDEKTFSILPDDHKVGDTWTEPTTGMEFVWIPAGMFWMGATDADQQAGYTDDTELPRHDITIRQGFWSGRYPVTQEAWLAVMGKNPAYFNKQKVGKDWGRHPVEQVSWDDCQQFLQRLNATPPPALPQRRGASPGERFLFRLPTEAEWEYACRANTDTIWYFGNDGARLKDYAWYDKNSGRQTHPVGQLQPNAWGLSDMHGNVWEWCADAWHDNYDGAPDDGSARERGGSNRVVRGGGWNFTPGDMRCAVRGFSAPSFRYGNLGVRLVRTE